MSAVFGKTSEIYGRIINDIAPDLIKEKYTFEDLSEFERKSLNEETGREYSGRVYWTEMLNRAHMASVASVFRTTRWIEVAIREHEAGSLYGCASACRSLIESAGDIGHSLSPVAHTLARIKEAVKAEISGHAPDAMIISKELEDSLIHFTHARKVAKTETAPDSHNAMPTFKYIDYVDRMKIPGVKPLYAKLCEIVHPAAESVSVTFVSEDGAWLADPQNESAVLETLLAERRSTLSGVVMASYNAPLLILKTLHSFDLFTKLSGLRKYRFDDIPEWQKIASALRS
ncbi:hypothetical protein NKI54_28700 [Mesorhizobium sp. M0663]|uniref:hypothetical protein n=1 Tax=unclassified Mesorhizobium TaxID=325217 RepID=UPI00333569CA